MKAAIRGRTLEYLSSSKKTYTHFVGAKVDLMELQVLLDEWLALGGPVDELSEEIENNDLNCIN